MPGDSKTQPESTAPGQRDRFLRKFFRWLVCALAVLILAVLIARPFLPNVVRWYVNRALDKSILYRGKIGDVNLHLWRGAYSIHGIQISKTTGNIPVPFFQADRLDLAIDYSALLHHRIVGRVLMVNPQVNFVDDPDQTKSETGAGGPWLQILSSLFPFDINSAELQDGSVHFRTYQKETPVDVYISHLNLKVDDLTNVDRSVTPLIATVSATATAMDNAKVELAMKIDPFSYYPTFHLGLRLLGLDLTKTNDLIEAYGGFNVKRGLFDLVVDIDSDEGELNGYVKPLFRNMVIFDLVRDVKEDNVLQVFWQALLGGASALVTNYQRDQLGTLIPFTGSVKGPQVDYLGTIGNVLRNAFIRAYLPRLESGSKTADDLHFGPPSLTDPISVGNEP